MTTSARPRVVAGLRLVRMVGSGAEGEVWEARDPRGSSRALKLIRPDALVEPDEVERRGRLLLDVDHPALVHVRRVGVLQGAGLDGWGFVDMDFVEGDSLASAPPDPDVLDRLVPLAEALDRLHAGEWSHGQPLVHRDIKPANILDTGDHLVLVDHSTLRAVGAETVTRIGTPLFAAPEVVTGRIGPAADRYSFAVTAVALLTGARGSDLARLLDDPDALADLDIPDGLRAGLSADPSWRPTTTAALLDPTTEVLFVEEEADEADGLGPAEVDGWDAHPGEPLGWPLAILTGVAGLAAAAVAGPPDGLPLLVAGALVLHLIAFVAARIHLAGALVPPVGWALLLADRAVGEPGRRRAWARAMTAGALSVLTWAVALPALTETTDALLVAAVAAALGLTAWALHVARAGGPALRMLLSPLWVLGAGVLVAAALVALLPAALLSRAGQVFAFGARTLGSVIAIAAPDPRRSRHTTALPGPLEGDDGDPGARA